MIQDGGWLCPAGGSHSGKSNPLIKPICWLIQRHSFIKWPKTQELFKIHLAYIRLLYAMKQEKNYKEELENLPMGSLLIEMDLGRHKKRIFLDKVLNSGPHPPTPTV